MNKKIDLNFCLICNGETTTLHDPGFQIDYDVCENCGFIHKQEAFHLSEEDEHKRYLLHHNDELNIGYRTYMENFVKLHVRPLKNVKTILDFGSGPYPMLKKVLENLDYDVSDFDPFFNNNIEYLNSRYDLIIATEVFEHIQQPMLAFIQLIELLNPKGKLVIMTQFRYMDVSEFNNWWYRRDQTHVSFFNELTFETICDILSLKIVSSNQKDVIVIEQQ